MIFREVNDLHITFESLPPFAHLYPDTMPFTATLKTVNAGDIIPLPDIPVTLPELSEPYKMDTKMESSVVVDPITDVAIVCSLDKVPEGYTAVSVIT